jgi:hypothetical protein
MNVKRYKMRTHYLDELTGLNQIISDETPNGEWVRWEDIYFIVEEYYKPFSESPYSLKWTDQLDV